MIACFLVLRVYLTNVTWNFPSKGLLTVRSSYMMIKLNGDLCTIQVKKETLSIFQTLEIHPPFVAPTLITPT